MSPRWRGVVVHHSASADSSGVDLEVYRDWHMKGRGWSDIGYHAVVEKIDPGYQVLAGRPLYRAGSHCVGYNESHIGVVFAGNFMDTTVPHGQLLAGANWIAGVVFALQIPPSDIVPHRDCGQTDCPGAQFPIDDLRTMIAALLFDDN